MINLKFKNKKYITFVYPSFKYKTGDIPWGILHLYNFLKKEINNIDIFIIDTNFNMSFSYVANQLKKNKSDIVAIYMDSLMYKDGMSVAKMAKDCGSNVIIGGPHPTVLPETVIKNKNVDAICLGEGEITLKEYVDEFYGNKNFLKIDGLWFKNGNKIIKNELRTSYFNLDEIFFDDLDCIDIKNYIKNWIQLDSIEPNLRGFSYIVSRGCPFKCTFCQPSLNKLFGVKGRIKSPELVVKELKILKERYGLNAFYFEDDLLTVFREWIKEFCKLMISNKINMKWACNSRVDTIDDELLDIMCKAGLVKIRVGIESYSDRILADIYHKGTSTKKIDEFMDMAKNHKVQISGFFMLGAPTETIDEIKKTIEFAINSDLGEAQFTINSPFIESHLYENSKKNSYNLPQDYDEFDYYKTKRSKLIKSDVDPKKLDRLKRYAYLSFYLNKKRLANTFKMVFSIRSSIKTYQKLKTYFF